MEDKVPDGTRGFLSHHYRNQRTNLRLSRIVRQHAFFLDVVLMRRWRIDW